MKKFKLIFVVLILTLTTLILAFGLFGVTSAKRGRFVATLIILMLLYFFILHNFYK